MQKTTANKVLKLVRETGILRARDLAAHNIPREYLGRLVKQGLLERHGRGLYMLTSADLTERHTFAQIAAKVPNGVICLLSALSFHELTTQSPSVVWLALPDKAWSPKLDYPPLRICWYSPDSFDEGIETHHIEGRMVKIYSVARTVADCFKYRNKIGISIALEALQDAWRQKKVTMAQIEKYAKICRVNRVMQPYLEALVA